MKPTSAPPLRLVTVLATAVVAAVTVTAPWRTVSWAAPGRDPRDGRAANAPSAPADLAVALHALVSDSHFAMAK